MGQVAVDFGTSNTVIARYNETLEKVDTIRVPDVSTELSYRIKPDDPAQKVYVIPSLIHYSEQETLIGDQVKSRGLEDHRDTFRWMKRAIAQGNIKRRKTPQGHIGYAQAGEDFLKLALNYASSHLSFTDDEFTFTVPVEAFEDFQDWIMTVAESIGIRRIRLLDEPTASIFGYHGAARKDERFVVFDFGGGTLDVSVVRLDLTSGADKKAIQLGRSGRDLGGSDIDQWMCEQFCDSQNLDDRSSRELESLIMNKCESVKMMLSDPTEDGGEVSIVNDIGSIPRVHQVYYTRNCNGCEQPISNPNSNGQVCLGCLLKQKNFINDISDAVDEALENAAVKAGMRRREITRLLVTGGTSLVPCVRKYLEADFTGKIVYDHPFDAVARGACKGIVAPVLQHDYAIESYNRERKEYEFKSFFKAGTDYPTERPIRYWANGAYDGQTRIGLKIFEVSKIKKRKISVSIYDDAGRLQDDSKVVSDYQHICLNGDNPTFIICDPPINRERDKRRFLCEFMIDGNRRLLVTVTDNMHGSILLKDHPVVRL